MDTDIEKRLDAEVKLEDFPSTFQPIVRAIGVPAALNMVRTAGGVNQYIPKYDTLIGPARDRMILQEFTGYNYRELALKYNLTEVWVRQIIDKDKAGQAREEYFKNQTALGFDEGVAS